MAVQLPGPIVTPAWLAEHLGAPGLKLVDASWYLSAEARDPAAEFKAGHIEGAVFFDIDGIKDPDNPLPHMLPNALLFAKAMGDLGLSSRNAIIVYDGTGMFSAPRAWWSLRTFGHDNVAVLDGGMPAWRAAGNGTVSGAATPEPAIFNASFRPELVRSLEQIRDNLANGGDQVVDARGSGRFLGVDPEVRPGIRSGHIPGSANLPYTELIDSTSNSLLPADKLAAAFSARGVDLARPTVTSCGSGITAAILALAMYICGHSDAAVYDGSWTEWGGHDDTPIDT